MLRGVVTDSHVSFPRLLIGSEGTLSVFTAATLRTATLPAHRCALLILFESVESAVLAVQTIAKQNPSACDLLDRRLLTLARDVDPRFGTLIPASAEAALIVEQTGFSHAELALHVHDLMKCLKELPDAGRSLFEATTVDEIEFLWSLAYRVIPLLNRARGELSPLPIVEDIAVPPEALPEFVMRARWSLAKARNHFVAVRPCGGRTGPHATFFSNATQPSAIRKTSLESSITRHFRWEVRSAANMALAYREPHFCDLNMENFTESSSKSKRSYDPNNLAESRERCSATIRI